MRSSAFFARDDTGHSTQESRTEPTSHAEIPQRPISRLIMNVPQSLCMAETAKVMIKDFAAPSLVGFACPHFAAGRLARPADR